MDTPTAEEWRPVGEAPGYQVSSLGRVMGRRGKPLTQTVNQFGYKTVSPYVGGKTLYRQAHRLVALAFIPNPDGLPLVNHKDGDRLNNSADNLEWVTAKRDAERVVKPAEDNARRSRKVVQIFPDGSTEVWGSISDAAAEAKISMASMAGYCRGGRVGADGNRWRFQEDYDVPPEGEEWAWVRPQDGKPPVEVSTMGRVRTDAGQIVTGTLKGVYLHYRGYGVHRLVAMAFCDQRAGHAVVNHLDGNPSNNSAANLEWTTQQGNCAHAHATGLCRRRPVRRTKPNGEITEYSSIKEASRVTHIAAGDIVGACKGRKPKAGGSRWEYVGAAPDAGALTPAGAPDTTQNAPASSPTKTSKRCWQTSVCSRVAAVFRPGNSKRS